VERKRKIKARREESRGKGAGNRVELFSEVGRTSENLKYLCLYSRSPVGKSRISSRSLATRILAFLVSLE